MFLQEEEHPLALSAQRSLEVQWAYILLQVCV